MADSYYMYISHRLGDICTWKFLLSLGQNPPPPRPTLTPGRIVFKIESLRPCVRRKAHTKHEVDWLNTIGDIFNRRTQISYP